MARYDTLMFTPAVQAEQDKIGSKGLYANRYATLADRLGPNEVDFLQSRTSIYMASVSETGWPYIQHRGGPVGFVKVLDDHTLAFADYRGNRQLISKGNLNGDDHVSLFAMDYPRKARLKLQGHATMVDAAEVSALAEQLATKAQGRVERVVTIRVAAFDWNCPQFITPRFDSSEIAQLVGPELDELHSRIAKLEAENAALRHHGTAK